MAAWSRLAPYAEMLSQLLATDQLVGSLADVGKKEIEGLAGAHEKLAHSFLSKHPARSSLRKKDIRAMQSMDGYYSLELALTLSTLVRHQSDGCTIFPTPLNADPRTNINPNYEEAVDVPKNVEFLTDSCIVGLTTFRSASASANLQFGSWSLASNCTPPRIFTYGLQLKIEVRTFLT